MISTKHDGSITPSAKPQVVEDYNKIMGFVDQSDQLSAYTPFVRRTTKWYLRIFFHLMTQTALVNSWKLYNDIVEEIRPNDFKMNIIESLLENERVYAPATSHSLEELTGEKAVIRKRCIGCYKRLSRDHGHAYASSNTRGVNSRCSRCKTHFCIECFQKMHKKCDLQYNARIC